MHDLCKHKETLHHTWKSLCHANQQLAGMCNHNPALVNYILDTCIEHTRANKNTRTPPKQPPLANKNTRIRQRDETWAVSTRIDWSKELGIGNFSVSAEKLGRNPRTNPPAHRLSPALCRKAQCTPHGWECHLMPFLGLGLSSSCRTCIIRLSWMH